MYCYYGTKKLDIVCFNVVSIKVSIVTNENDLKKY
jgi:hypothetical protein